MKHWWLFCITVTTLGLCVVGLFVVRLRPVPISSSVTSSAEATLQEPTITVANPQKGPKDAAITIVEYGDFQCVSCRELASTLDTLQRTYPDQVRIVWKHFPNETVHPLATKAGEAAACAKEQNAFWLYHDELYRRQTYLSEGEFPLIARDLELNTDIFTSCLNNDETLPLVRRDFEEGLALGLAATPTIYLNQEKIVGAISLNELDAKIRSLLKP